MTHTLLLTIENDKRIILQLADIVSDTITELETNGDPDNEPWLDHARNMLKIARKRLQQRPVEVLSDGLFAKERQLDLADRKDMQAPPRSASKFIADCDYEKLKGS